MNAVSNITSGPIAPIIIGHARIWRYRRIVPNRAMYNLQEQVRLSRFRRLAVFTTLMSAELPEEACRHQMEPVVCQIRFLVKLPDVCG